MHRSTCPDIIDLVDSVQITPAATADYERDFNVMKMVKTDWRSRVWVCGHSV